MGYFLRKFSRRRRIAFSGRGWQKEGQSSRWLAVTFFDRVISVGHPRFDDPDRPHVLCEMIYVCRPASTFSVFWFVRPPDRQDSVLGAAMNKRLTSGMGQTHVNRWTDDLLQRIVEGQIDPSLVVAYRSALKKVGRCPRCPRQGGGCIAVITKP